MNLKNEDRDRLNGLLEVLLRYTVMDFSQKAVFSEKGDEIDAIAAGINALVEELEVKMNNLRESEERFRLLIEEIKDYAIFLVDPDGYVKSWNKGAEAIKGYKAEEIIGKHISVFYTKEELEANEPQYNLGMAKKNGRHRTEGWRRRKNGKLFWAEISLTAVYDQNGQLRGFSKVTKDGTPQRMADYALKEKSEELARSNAELEQFAYVASHDLQEPLRMVTSYVQLLAKRYKGKLDQDADEFIAFAVDGSTRMRTLINSLLEYSRVNREKPFEMVEIDKVLADLEQTLGSQIEENKVKLNWQNMPVVFGDQVLLSQLFQNLISNAIKFRGAASPEIDISCKQMENEYLFGVKDNGIGIQKEYSDKIFVIFQRLHSKEQYPGTGIGLAICKKIVERHGGKIWVESEPDKGSTFYFTLKKFK